MGSSQHEQHLLSIEGCLFTLLFIALFIISAIDKSQAEPITSPSKNSVNVSMLHRQGMNLVFAVSHPYLTCEKVTFKQKDGETVAIIPVKPAPDDCPRPLVSSIIAVPVTNDEIVSGNIAIEITGKWKQYARHPKQMFILRDEYSDPFRKERLKITGE